MSWYLKDILAATWYEADKNRSPNDWRNQVANKSTYIEAFKNYQSLTAAQRSCVDWVLAKVQFELVPVFLVKDANNRIIDRLSAQRPEKGKSLVEQWGVDNAIGWAHDVFRTLQVASLTRTEDTWGPHRKGLAVDFATTKQFPCVENVILYLLFAQNYRTFDYGIGLGPTNRMHLHLDVEGRRAAWIEPWYGETYQNMSRRDWENRLKIYGLSYGTASTDPATFEPEPKDWSWLLGAAIGGALGYDDKNYVKPALYAAGGAAAVIAVKGFVAGIKKLIPV